MHRYPSPNAHIAVTPQEHHTREYAKLKSTQEILWSAIFPAHRHVGHERLLGVGVGSLGVFILLFFKQVCS